MPAAPRFVAYLRVSTVKQGAHGLGMDAKRDAVERHVAGAGGDLVRQFVEVERGHAIERAGLHG